MTLTQSPSVPTLPWTRVCALADILPGTGVCALVHGEQVAVFHLAGRVFALSNRDPFTGANVLSRGLTGSYVRGGQTRFKVASPLLKHAFDLETGESLDVPGVHVPVYAARTEGGDVWTGSLA
ncbi:nitrite reductase small subunit NirD (plasmid) [Deinococcus taeanensis]|uniref:nitrite reductase small subunit NirD n=1 Tax=Deinococcus taeanensis TaxID=2737050 RepID=UPI001CDBD5AF|nr:nitrite reductase small subunit NirD [Deinococcus taeanensis]UBV45143.1 nitrite reductase small subunit NirD [Deinococcus taeanensis]